MGWYNDFEQEELDYELGAMMGDPRRCPHHPHVKTSSNDGMFDAPCGECEAAMYEREEVTTVEPWFFDFGLCEVLVEFYGTRYPGDEGPSLEGARNAECKYKPPVSWILEQMGGTCEGDTKADDLPF